MIKMISLLFLFTFSADIMANRYAVIIGQNDGGRQYKPLKYAEDDARRFSDLLIDIGGFEPNDVISLMGTDSLEINDALKKTAEKLANNKAETNSLFLLYYSGHADETSILLGKSRYSFEALQKEISNFPSRIRIAIFDACQSGVITAFKGGARADPFYLQNQPQVKGQVIIASSAANERAQESDALKGSVFSFHWLNGLRGSADLSADRKITLNEAYQYAYRKTVETSALASGEIQHPVYRFSIQGQGDILLTDLEKASGGILIEKSCVGKFLVLSENYLDVFADFYKDKTVEQFISLAPGRYTIINAQGRDVGTYQFAISKNRRKLIRKSDFEPVTLVQSRLKGFSSSETSTEEQTTGPLSRFSLDFGTGLMMDKVGEGQVWKRDMLVNIGGLYQINQNIDFKMELGGLINRKVIDVQTGIDYVFGLEKGKISLGGDPGLEFYGSKKYNTSKNIVSPLLSARLAFTADISERFHIQLYVPYKTVFNRSTIHRTGIGLRFLFSGRFKDVQIIK